MYSPIKPKRHWFGHFGRRISSSFGVLFKESTVAFPGHLRSNPNWNALIKVPCERPKSLAKTENRRWLSDKSGKQDMRRPRGAARYQNP